MVFSTPANLRTPFCISSKKHHLKKTALSGQEGPGGRTGIGEEHKGVVSEHWDSSKVILLSKFRWPAIFWPFLVGGWTKPLWKIRERQNGFIDLSPIFRCENKKCLSCHHLAIIPKLELFGHFEDIPILNHHLGWLLGGSDFPGDPSSPPLLRRTLQALQQHQALRHGRWVAILSNSGNSGALVAEEGKFADFFQVWHVIFWLVFRNDSEIFQHCGYLYTV